MTLRSFQTLPSLKSWLNWSEERIHYPCMMTNFFKTVLSNIQYLSLVRLTRESMYYLSLVELTPHGTMCYPSLVAAGSIPNIITSHDSDCCIVHCTVDCVMGSVPCGADCWVWKTVVLYSTVDCVMCSVPRRAESWVGKTVVLFRTVDCVMGSVPCGAESWAGKTVVLY